MKNKTHFLKVPFRAHLALPILLALSACGGGGGDGSATVNVAGEPAEPAPPVARELVKLTVDATYDTPSRAFAVYKDDNIVYVADHSAALLVLEITDSRQLRRLGTIQLADDVKAYSLAMSGDYLYVAGREGGLSVVNVAQPLNPIVGQQYDTPDIAMYVTVNGDRLYLSDRQGMIGFDISDPAQPYQIWSSTAESMAFLRSFVDGDKLAIAGYTDGVKVFASPANEAVEESSVKIGRPVWSITPYIDPDSGTPYYLVGGERAGLTIFDPEQGDTVGGSLPLTPIENPSPSDETAYDIVSWGHFAIVADGNNGIMAVSLDDIRRPYLAGGLRTNGDARDILVDSDTLIVADSNRGVHLLTIAAFPDDDGDGFANADDHFPSDPQEWRDADGDGIGNNADTDDDNDGIEDSVDDDADNDGYENNVDAFPDDPQYWIDSDGDGFGDNNPLLLVDNESHHTRVNGDWEFVISSNAFIGSSYLTKISDNAGDFVRWFPIVTREGAYNVYAAGLHTANPNISQVSSYVVNTNGTSTKVSFDLDAKLRNWNYLGEYIFSQGNSASITLLDEGDGISEVFGDGVLLVPSLTVPQDFDSNYRYEFLGNYTNEDLRVWNLKRLLVDPVGNNILYAAFNSTADLCSIDIADPTNPRLLNCYISEDDGAGYEMVRKGNHLILADRYAGIRVFEITGRGSFSLVASVPTIDKASRVVLDGDILYVGDTLSGLLTYDVTDPADPVFLGRAEIGAEARDIRIKDNYAFVGNYFFGLAVLDVTDPSNPTLVARLRDPWNVFLGGGWDLEIKGDLLYMAVQSLGVQIIDISNPVAPRVISEIQVPNGREFEFSGEIHDDQPPLDLELVNNLLIVSNGAHGVLLFDVTETDNIQLVERIDTPSIAGEAELHGSILYVADGRGSGLQIYDIEAYSYLYDPQQ